MRIVNFTDARNNLKAVMDQAVADADVTVVTRRDADDAVIMSFDYYSSLLETLHLLGSPANAAHLAKSLDQARNGLVQSRQLFDVAETEGPDAGSQIYR